LFLQKIGIHSMKNTTKLHMGNKIDELFSGKGLKT
jgi:hypothetical protein